MKATFAAAGLTAVLAACAALTTTAAAPAHHLPAPAAQASPAP